MEPEETNADAILKELEDTLQDQDDDPLLSEEEDAGPEADESEEQEGDTVKIGDLELSRDELLDLVEKGRDYTRKTQQLAEERRRFREVAELYETFNSLPDDQKQAVVDAIIERASQREGGVARQLREYGYDEDFVRVVEDIEDRNAKLMAKVAALENTLARLLPEFEGFVKEVKGDVEAQEAAKRIAEELGVEVSPEELRAAQAKTGLDDLEAAWLKLNKAKLVAGAFVKGHKAGSVRRPISPAGEARTPDLSKMTADEILRAVESGLIGPPE